MNRLAITNKQGNTTPNANRHRSRVRIAMTIASPRFLAPRPRSEPPPDQLSMFQMEHPVVDRLRALEPDGLTPREALDLLYELRRSAKGEKNE